MGVQEILDILDKGDKLTCLEISKKVVYCERTVRRLIATLLKDVSEDLEFRVLTEKEKQERYGHTLSREVRLFWLGQ
jgi:hypothetical protein